MIQSYLERLPLVAILRGVTPDEILPIGRALVDAGFVMIEIPLNSPRPIESIALLHEELGAGILVGAGTVTKERQVREIAEAGGGLVVMPHSDPMVIRAAKTAGLICTPGIATPNEGFAALANGADALKLFPAELLTPAVLRAMRSVFPTTAKFLPVGGITPDSMGEYVAAGAAGFGLGSALYRRGDGVERVATNARAFVDAWRRIARGAST
jgi:2-dehydro-3-deoxyphosphogalactonate aldolase